MSMTRQSYESRLSDLAYRELVNPTLDQLACVLPHLTRDELRQLRECGTAGEPGIVVAAPGLIYNGVYQRLTCYRDETGTWRLRYASPGRTAGSFHYRRDWPTPEFRDVQYTERAIDYSCAMWGDQLCWDTTTYVVDICVHAMHGQVTNTFAAHATAAVTSQLDDWWDSSGTSLVEPAGELLDDQIARIATRYPARCELREFHVRRCLDICGWCGGTLTSSDDVPCCAFCGRRTPMLFPLCRRSWAAAIPRSVEAGLTLEGRWRFEQDPAITRRSEHLAWLGLPMESLNASDPMTGRQARSICLNATRKT